MLSTFTLFFYETRKFLLEDTVDEIINLYQLDFGENGNVMTIPLILCKNCILLLKSQVKHSTDKKSSWKHRS